MAIPAFWVMMAPAAESRLAKWAEDMEVEQILCPTHPEHMRGGKRIGPLKVTLSRGPQLDFIWTWYNECMIQDNVLQAFRDHGLTGFEAAPVEASFRKSSGSIAPPRLWELIITGWAGIAAQDSGVQLIRSCDACGLLKYSPCSQPDRLINWSQWDGSDLFVVWPLPAFIFVTERVAQVIRSRRMRGVKLSQITQCGLEDGSGFSPGRLSYWMPEARARELGGPLGIV